MTTEILPKVEGEELEDVASGLHGVVATNIASYLLVYVRSKKLGYVVGDNIEFEVPGLGTKTKKPDAAFVSIEKMPVPIDDIIPFAPDLAVEVISRTDAWKEILSKARVYLKAGTRLVWSVDPYSRSIFVFKLKNKVAFEVVNGDAELDGEDVVPGFKLPLSAIFDYPALPDDTDSYSDA